MFKIILSDDNVKAVLGISLWYVLDLIAEGIIGAVEEVSNGPVVVRLKGNNAEKGSAILADSGLNIIAATSLNRRRIGCCCGRGAE